jgi:hypothetical protein
LEYKELLLLKLHQNFMLSYLLLVDDFDSSGLIGQQVHSFDYLPKST